MKDNQKALVKFVQKEFEAQKDAQKSMEMAAYMKTDMPFYGVQKPDRVPIYRAVLKQFPPKNQSDYEQNILALWNLPHREEKYMALEYAFKFGDYVDSPSIELYENLVRTGAWWDLVDPIAITLVGHAYLKDRPGIKRLIDRFSDDKDMWVRRTSLICHNHHKSQTDHTQLFRTCKKLSQEKEFFIRKAIGWALREYSYVDQGAVQKFVDDNELTLAPLTRNEALKAIKRKSQRQ